MLPAEILYRGIVNVKSNTVHWDNDTGRLLPRRTLNTVSIRFKLEGNPNYISVTRISHDSIGFQISDGNQTTYVFLKGGVKIRCTLDVGIRNSQQGWRAFQVELLSENNKALNRLYRPMSGFLSHLMNQSPELRKTFRSWHKGKEDCFIFDCEFSPHRDKVYNYFVHIDNQRYSAVIGTPLSRLFKKIKAIRDERLI